MKASRWPSNAATTPAAPLAKDELCCVVVSHTELEQCYQLRSEAPAFLPSPSCWEAARWSCATSGSDVRWDPLCSMHGGLVDSITLGCVKEISQGRSFILARAGYRSSRASLFFILAAYIKASRWPSNPAVAPEMSFEMFTQQ